MNNDLPPRDGAENPFRSPPDARHDFQPDFTDGETIRGSSNFVRHISIVATLMIINGVIMFLVGLAALAFTAMLLVVPEFLDEMEDSFQNLMVWIYGLVGILILVIATLQLVAGIRNLGFRSRKFGMIALGVGLASIFTCYCAPTSIGLAVYGLVVYLNPEVEQAFRLRKEGHTKEEVLTMLNV